MVGLAEQGEVFERVASAKGDFDAVMVVEPARLGAAMPGALDVRALSSVS